MAEISIQLAGGRSKPCGLASVWSFPRVGRFRHGRETDTPTPDRGDFLPPELVHLLGTAGRVIDQHVNHLGTCGACGSSWPCQRAQLAEFTLGAL
jgi:hypothetical protein